MTLRTALISVLVLSMSLGLSACSKPKDKEEKYLQRGNELFEEGEYVKAKLEYKNALRIVPTDAEAHYRMGMANEALGDIKGAFTSFSVATQQNPHMHPALLKVAQYLLVAEQYEEALKRVSTVLGDDPNNPEAHATYAALLLRQSKFEETEKEARLALEKDPTNTTAFSTLTGLYVAQNNEDKAIETIEEGISRNRGNLPLLLLKAMVYEKIPNTEKVIETYQEIIKLKPDEARFRTDLASIYLKEGKKDEAEAILRDGVAAMPGNIFMKQRLVAFLGENRGLDVAEKEVRETMKDNPDNGDLYFWLADLYATHNAVDRAIALLEQIVEKDQFDNKGLNARASLARIHFLKGDKSLAEKLVKLVLDKSPDNQEALFIRARMSFDDGNYQGATADLRTIIRNNPKAVSAYQLLAETLLMQGHLNLATDTLNQLVGIDASNTVAQVRLAQMYALSGDSKRALDLLAIVTKTKPEYAIGWESTARIAIGAQDWLVADAAINVLDTLEGQRLTATFLKGQVLSSNGKKDEAAMLYMQVINADPGAPLSEHALSALVDDSQSTGKLQTAIDYMRGLKTDSTFVATLMGECLIKEGKTEEAAPVFDKLIAGKISIQDPYIDRAKIYLKDGKTDQAIEVLREAQKNAPSDIRAAMMSADILGTSDKYKEAISIYEEILSRNPEADAAANNLAQLIADYEYTDSALMEKARQYAERFANAENPWLLDTLCWVYFRQGNMPMAVSTMERVKTLAGENKLPPQVHYHHGAILAKNGKLAEAKEELAQAVVEKAAYSGIEDARKLMASLSGQK